MRLCENPKIRCPFPYSALRPRSAANDTPQSTSVTITYEIIQNSAPREIFPRERHRGLQALQRVAGTLCPHRLNQPLGAKNLHDAFHIVGQHVKAHFRADVLEALGQKMRRSHPSLQRAERVLDCLAS